MKNKIDGSDEIEKLFNKILGTKVTIKDNIDQSEEIIFKAFVDKLDKNNIIESQLFEISGLDVTNIVDPLYSIIESTFRMLYGQEATDMVLWYIHDRFDADGNIVKLDFKGKTFILKDSNDLWNYIKYKSPK